MKAIKARIDNLYQVFDGSSLRQRIMVSAAMLICIHAAWDFLLHTPHTTAVESQNGRLVEETQRIAELNQQLSAMLSEGSQENAELAALTEEIEVLDQQIEMASSEFISPGQMPDVLQHLLADNTKLRITQLKTLPAKRINGGNSDTEDDNQTVADADQETSDQDVSESAVEESDRTPVFRHEVTLEFEGDYLSTLEYIRSIEQLGWRIFWDRVHIDSTQYPRSRVSMSLYTLSLDEGWIGV